MIIEVYGKQGCELCKSAKKKLSVMLDRWSLDDDEIEIPRTRPGNLAKNLPDCITALPKRSTL